MKRPTHLADHSAAAKQELIWAKSAMNEYHQELARAKKAKKRGFHVLASELMWDVKQCKKWHDMRVRRAKSHLKEVKSIKRSK